MTAQLSISLLAALLVLHTAVSDAGVPASELPPEVVKAVRERNESTERLLRKSAKNLQAYGVQKVGDDYCDKELFIFISSSMPDKIVKRYIEQTEGIEDSVIFVLRGFVEGIEKFGPTRDYVVRILCEDSEPGSSDCLTAVIDINPDLFEIFGVDSVPAFLFVPEGRESLSGCGALETPGKWWLSYGDANLAYHLARMEKASGSPRVTGLIKGIKRPCYDYEENRP